MFLTIWQVGVGEVRNRLWGMSSMRILVVGVDISDSIEVKILYMSNSNINKFVNHGSVMLFNKK